jgi:hypothetical protein
VLGLKEISMRVLLILFVAVLFTAPALAQGGMLVVVDPSHPSYTVLISVPAEKRREIERSHPSAKTFSYVSLEDFRKNPKQYVSKKILIASYSTPRFFDRLGQLVAKYPGTPVGVVFNGGVAITYNDYTHADRMYAIWNRDKNRYLEVQNLPENTARDPIHPEAHFGPLLGPPK